MSNVTRLVHLGLAACLLLGCGNNEEHQLTPWFRVVTRRHTVIAPHLLALGENSETGLMLQDGRWREVVKGYAILRLYPVGDGLLASSFQAVHLLQEGRAPVLLPEAECPDVAPRADAPVVVCTGCGSASPLISVSETSNTSAPCPVVTATGRALSGEVLWTRSGVWPVLPKECLRGRRFTSAFTPEGDPLYVASCQSRTPEGQWNEVRREFVLTPRGLEEREAGGPRTDVRQVWPRY
ncbi:MAG: hypothetical protein WBV82_21860 [Myxococcaceae bacterium]